MKKYDERICRYAMNRIFGFRPRNAHLLTQQAGSAAAAFARCGSEGAYAEAERELKDIEAAGCRFVCNDEDAYPPLLKECDDHPTGIYMRSVSPPEEVFSPDAHFISFVGTRDCSLYGREWCEKLVSALASVREKCVIVSGLAIGIDIAAHRAALSAGLPTIAVLPTGIDSIYPYRHRRDAEIIANTPGCALVTDYPPGTAPLAVNFLRRNRIIAGLAEATVLVESKEKGGGMGTARLAFSYDREVYALPGRVDDIRSQGCNRLLFMKMAEPIVSEEALIGSLGLTREKEALKGGEAAGMVYVGKLPDADVELLSRIILLIKEERGIEMDEVAARCGISYKKGAELLSILECDEIISIDMMRRCCINTKNNKNSWNNLVKREK